MKVASVSKIKILKLQMILGSNFIFVKDGVPKNKIFTTIFGARLKTTVFSNFFQYLLTNYHNRIVLIYFFISFGNTLHIFGQIKRNYAPFREFTEKEATITTFSFFDQKIFKILPNKTKNMKELF